MNKLNKILLRLVIVFMPLLLLLSVYKQGVAQENNNKLVSLCNEYNILNTNIRDNKINKTVARAQVKKIIQQIEIEYVASGGHSYTVKEWVFPLNGYGYKAIGGVKGNGYQKGGYDYFDGNKHTGHPSQDIFMRDKKQTNIDDITKKPVRVLSVSGGVVVAVEKNWEISSQLRGGKYIWIYDPTSNALIYYAHNSNVLVNVGEIVKPGDSIAEVGRTGLNAYKKRSPTHLHLTYLQITDGVPTPKNIYKELITSKLL